MFCYLWDEMTSPSVSHYPFSFCMALLSVFLLGHLAQELAGARVSVGGHRHPRAGARPGHGPRAGAPGPGPLRHHPLGQRPTRNGPLARPKTGTGVPFGCFKVQSPT